MRSRATRWSPTPPLRCRGWRFAIARQEMVPHPTLRCRGFRFAIARREMIPHPPMRCRGWRFATARRVMAPHPPLRCRGFRFIPPPFTVPSTSVNDSDWHVEGGFYEKYATINHVIAPEWGAYKKNNKMATVSARTIKKYVH